MRNLLLGAALVFLTPGIAGAQPVGEPSGGLARQRATLVPPEWVPPMVRDAVERDAGSRRYVVRRMHIGDTDIFEGDYGDGRVRVSEDGRVLGRDAITR
jgi:hypothetical protein